MAQHAGVTKKAEQLSEASWSVLRRDLEALGADIVKLSEKSLTDGQGKVAEEAQRLKAVVTDLIDRAESNGRSSLDEVSVYVTKRPVTSLAVAFASGMVLATLVSNQRR
jgi:ElaB/YqjD/DUF883 family membrane-anchored ribosome-binding protein